jgi:hypothetical protein
MLSTILEFHESHPGDLNRNPLDENDVNGDGFVSPLDVLQGTNGGKRVTGDSRWRASVSTTESSFG